MKANAFSGQLIKDGSADIGIPVGAEERVAVVIAEQQQDIGTFGGVTGGDHRQADGEEQAADAGQQWSGVGHNGGFSSKSGANRQPLLQVSEWSVWRQTAGRGDWRRWPRIRA